MARPLADVLREHAGEIESLDTSEAGIIGASMRQAADALDRMSGELNQACSKLDTCLKRLDIRQDGEGGQDEIDRLTAALHNSEFDVEQLQSRLDDSELIRRKLMQEQHDQELGIEVIGEALGLERPYPSTTEVAAAAKALVLRLDAYEKRIDEQRTIIEAGQKSARPVLDELESLRSRLDGVRTWLNHYGDDVGMTLAAELLNALEGAVEAQNGKCSAGNWLMYADGTDRPSEKHYCELPAGHSGDHKQGDHTWPDLRVTSSVVETPHE